VQVGDRNRQQALKEFSFGPNMNLLPRGCPNSAARLTVFAGPPERTESEWWRSKSRCSVSPSAAWGTAIGSLYAPLTLLSNAAAVAHKPAAEATAIRKPRWTLVRWA